MTRRLGYAFLLAAIGSSVAAGVIERFEFEPVSGAVGGVPLTDLLAQVLLVAAVGFAVSDGYVLVL